MRRLKDERVATGGHRLGTPAWAEGVLAQRFGWAGVLRLDPTVDAQPAAYAIMEFASVNLPQLRAMTRWVILPVTLALGGCGLAAAPCRVTSAALDIVPLVGHVAAAPTNGCAAAIDPGG